MAVTACAAACAHGSILRSVAQFLVVDEPCTPAQALLMVGGDSRFDAAANLHADGAKTILLVHQRPGRLERMGIVQSAEQSTRRELLARGIPEDDLLFLSDEPVENERVGKLLCDWLRQQPHRQVNVLCDRFSTRKWRLLLRRSADLDLVSRIHLVALPHRGFNEANWWHSKPGARAILNGYLRLGFTYWHDGPQAEGKECTPADFESACAPRATP
jgi:hypothetical protein